MTLSSRLEALFDELLPGFPVWDVGYDHGQLGLFALASGNFPQVHFVDPVAELARQLRSKLTSHNFSSLKDRAHVHVCPLSDLQAQVQGSLVFAGVGAHTILSNIETLMMQSRFYARRVILSPHRDADLFLKKRDEWAPLFSQRYTHLSTKEVSERGRKRLIYIFEPNSCVSC